MTFASAIRFAAPLLLAATLAGCALPYDDDPYNGGYNSSDRYYGGSYSYGGPYYGGSAYATVPSRHHRTRRQRVHERPGLEQRHRRDRAERLWEARRATADRPGDRRRRERGFRRDRQIEAGVRDRTADDRAERAARRDRRAERQIVRQRAGERAAAERRARRAERQTQERSPAPRRYDDYRDSGETDAAFTRRVQRAGRQAERESMTIERILAAGAVPEK